jgi:hypothetical protein
VGARPEGAANEDISTVAVMKANTCSLSYLSILLEMPFAQGFLRKKRKIPVKNGFTGQEGK